MCKKLTSLAEHNTIDISKLDQLVEDWHNSNDSRSLQEYLGLTGEQMQAYVHGVEIING